VKRENVWEGGGGSSVPIVAMVHRILYCCGISPAALLPLQADAARGQRATEVRGARGRASSPY